MFLILINLLDTGINRGNVNAGFSGGNRGIAQTSSISQTVEIPLDDQGTVMFSNLKEKPHAGGKGAKKPSNHKKLDMRPELSA